MSLFPLLQKNKSHLRSQTSKLILFLPNKPPKKPSSIEFAYSGWESRKATVTQCGAGCNIIFYFLWQLQGHKKWRKWGWNPLASPLVQQCRGNADHWATWSRLGKHAKNSALKVRQLRLTTDQWQRQWLLYLCCLESS